MEKTNHFYNLALMAPSGTKRHNSDMSTQMKGHQIWTVG